MKKDWNVGNFVEDSILQIKTNWRQKKALAPCPEVSIHQ